jgi:lysophospholipase L1-like esterase
VFVGSSIFYRWSALNTQMSPLAVTKVSFDGGQTSDMLAILKSRVIPLRPKVIAYYAGSNDVDLDEPASAIVERIIEFFDRVHAALPGTQVVFVSVIRSRDHQYLWNVIDDINRRIQTYAESSSTVEFVDVNPVLADSDGSARLDFFMPDERHLRPAAYVEVAKILKPVLTRALTAP